MVVPSLGDGSGRQALSLPHQEAGAHDTRSLFEFTHLLSAYCMLGTIPGSGTSEVNFHVFRHILSTCYVSGTCDTKVLTDSVRLLSACCVRGAELCVRAGDKQGAFHS